MLLGVFLALIFLPVHFDEFILKYVVLVLYQVVAVERIVQINFFIADHLFGGPLSWRQRLFFIVFRFVFSPKRRKVFLEFFTVFFADVALHIMGLNLNSVLKSFITLSGDILTLTCEGLRISFILEGVLSLLSSAPRRGSCPLLLKFLAIVVADSLMIDGVYSIAISALILVNSVFLAMVKTLLLFLSLFLRFLIDESTSWSIKVAVVSTIFVLVIS